ncbi:RluA family pseudouridine synthase [Candidatus Velamenicoccus archaeovorus]|nr:RluA family pseudouridine synthase [Candidatus Velamenicoccus archaeovorus]
MRRKRSRNINESAMQKDHLKGIKIVYEDRDILVVDKPPKLLTMASNTEKERTAYHILTDYVRKGCAASRNRIFIVHRLDRDTSGIVIFAKNERAKNSLQQQWDQTEKKYLAVVYGSFPQKSGEITSYLAENAAHIVFSTRDRSIGKLSTTIYKTLKETKGFSLLEVDLATGRKNQIRVHFAEKGHPIVGDRKYGGRDAMHKRMALHAYSISFLHPWNGRRMILKTPVPAYFTELVGDFTL